MTEIFFNFYWFFDKAFCENNLLKNKEVKVGCLKNAGGLENQKIDGIDGEKAFDEVTFVS